MKKIRIITKGCIVDKESLRRFVDNLNLSELKRKDNMKKETKLALDEICFLERLLVDYMDNLEIEYCLTLQKKLNGVKKLI